MVDFTAAFSHHDEYEHGYLNALCDVRIMVRNLREQESEEGRQYIEDWLTQEIIDAEND